MLQSFPCCKDLWLKWKCTLCINISKTYEQSLPGNLRKKYIGLETIRLQKAFKTSWHHGNTCQGPLATLPLPSQEHLDTVSKNKIIKILKGIRYNKIRENDDVFKKSCLFMRIFLILVFGFMLPTQKIFISSPDRMIMLGVLLSLLLLMFN